MNEYAIEPEVAGELGPSTVMDGSVHPPRVEVLEYRLVAWLGDDLLESFPCLVVTDRLASRLREGGLTGFTLADVTVSTDGDARHRRAEPLPRFRWLQVTGRRGADDLWVGDDLRLQVTSTALEVLRGHVDHALVEPVDGDSSGGES